MFCDTLYGRKTQRLPLTQDDNVKILPQDESGVHQDLFLTFLIFISKEDEKKHPNRV